MNDRDKYLIKRRKAKIKLREIAEYIGCHITLLSKYECDAAMMAPEKIVMYRQYIDQRTR